MDKSRNIIHSLTLEQTARFPEFVDKWLRIGLSCEPCDVEKARAAAKMAYRLAGLGEPSLFFIADSPLSCAVMVTMLRKIPCSVNVPAWDQVGAQVRAHVWTQVRDQVRDHVRAQVEAQVRDQVGDQVWDQVEDQVEDQVGAQVRAQVGDQVRAQVGDQVVAQVGDQVRDHVWVQVRAHVGAHVWAQVGVHVWAQVGARVGDQVGDQVYGCHDSGWLSYYDYFMEVCNIDECKNLVGLFELAKHCGWWAPYTNMVILQHRPCEIHLNNKILHNESGMAIKYRDGFGVYALSGIRVPGWLVMTPAHEIDCRKVLRESNADIRREIVRKVGIEKVCEQLGAKCIDKQDNYELLMLDIGDGRQRPYLKMRNPSIGVYHIEGVHPDCLTVETALNWRNGSWGTKPRQLT